MAKEKDIFLEEEHILQEASELLKKGTVNNQDLITAYKKLTTAYSELLDNAKFLTTVSDRFQEKLKMANTKLEKQAENINEINLLLDMKNRSLEKDLNKINHARIQSHIISYEEFEKVYPTRDKCLAFLATLKWKDGYECRRCKNKKHCEGRTSYSRRCTKCRYDESATAYTIYHKCKFELPKAFYMTMLINALRGEISSYELADIIGIRQKTCWAFKNKIISKMSSKVGQKAQIRGDWSLLVIES